jgi:two-component system, OmpR family, response regulator ChvI
VITGREPIDRRNLLSKIVEVCPLLNGQTLSKKKATYGRDFTNTRYAVVLLAATTLDIFEDYAIKIRNDNYFDLFRLERVANHLTLDYDRIMEARKIYEDLEHKGEVRIEFRDNNIYLSLTEKGRKHCYKKLEELAKLKNYFSSLPLLQDKYTESQFQGLEKPTSHTAKMLSALSNLTGTINKESNWAADNELNIDKLISSVSNWQDEDISGESIKADSIPYDKRSQKRIMFVDDESDLTYMYKTGLEANGFAVDTFNDPTVALSNFKAFKYDLLLLDVKMPFMNGFELYKEIEKVDNDVKVCFITAFEIYYEALREVFPSRDGKTINCFFRKPIALDDLVCRIKEELDYTA